MKEIKDYLQNGLASQIFQAEMNLLLWDKVAEKASDFSKQDEYVQRLFSYIQQSAQTNFILYTSKIFDNPNKKYPTRCLLSLFDLIEKNNIFSVIESYSATKQLCERFNCPQSLINTIKNSNSSFFAMEFCTHFRKKYTNFLPVIEEVKYMRDKYIAHNEYGVGNKTLELSKVRNLLKFANEVVSIFDMAYFNSIWTFTDGESLISESAEKSAYFLTPTFDKLLKR